MAYSLTWLPETLRSAGLKVAEHPGWADRGRGPMSSDIRGVICHHTGTPGPANMPTLRMLVEGRPDLPGPLAQLGLARDGTFYVVAAGRCNHAGAGEWKGASGNSHFIGIEAENSGRDTEQPWPDVQLDAYARGVAAILRKLDLDADTCCGHKEYAPRRKIDPTFDMNAFRERVTGVMGGTATVRPLIPADDGAGRPTLRRGARGDLVRSLQAGLGLAQDGVFGPGTEAKLRNFQRSNGVVPDGIVGPKTWKLIDAAGGAAVATAAE